jgi:hypothetical protein
MPSCCDRIERSNIPFLKYAGSRPPILTIPDHTGEKKGAAVISQKDSRALRDIMNGAFQ